MSACRYLTVTEACEYLALSRNTVYKLVEVGKLGHHRAGVEGGKIRFTPDQLDAYLASTRVEPAGAGREPAPSPGRAPARRASPPSPAIPDPTGLRARARRAGQT